jgi:hypothetical protein
MVTFRGAAYLQSDSFKDKQNSKTVPNGTVPFGTIFEKVPYFCICLNCLPE